MLNVTSEIGRLRTVMVHLPGREIERMVPSMMGELLFDDILFGEVARNEHRRFQRILAMVADEVLLLQELLAAALADSAIRAAVVEDFAEKLRLDQAVLDALATDDNERLATQLIEGLERADVTRMPERPSELYLLPPLANLLFHRDPALVIGKDVVISSMATRARLREPLLLQTVFNHHPRFRDLEPIFASFDADFRRRSTAHPRPMIEGGDVIVAREDLLIIGSSIRTARGTIEDLALALQHAKCPIQRILVVELPQSRSYMHLDTVFTIINHDECLVYEPVIIEDGVEQAAVYQLELGNDEIIATSKHSLLSALAELGIDLRPITCGGGADLIAQQREQWTDGANAFALAPGKILLYHCNLRTAEELSNAGYQVVTDEDLLLGRVSSDILADEQSKVLIQITGHELSRARGGPRCLTMPLRRD
ncbi:MAG: hypothetical protein H6707_06465 [Deltaproteobacteria bacterium]|nr:hypothetical protein [Deltaproteobacteria bacterium]